MNEQVDRCLSICEPWAWACVTFKSIENRTWSTSFRGRVAVHAPRSLAHLENPANESFLLEAHPRIAAAFDDERITESSPLFHLGAIVGSVEIVDCVPFDPAKDDPDVTFAAYVNSHAAPEIPHGMWAEGPVCWVLAKPRRYRQPIAAKGALNLWRLSPELAAAVAAAELDDPITDAGEPSLPPLVVVSADAPRQPAATPPKSSAADRRKRAALTGQQLPSAGKKR